ncbi:MAG: hypothetical protein P8Y72_14070, partial [Anaerolineales bacterium]
ILKPQSKGFVKIFICEFLQHPTPYCHEHEMVFIAVWVEKLIEVKPDYGSASKPAWSSALV